MGHGGVRERSGRKKGSKDKLTRTEIDKCRPKLYQLLESIIDGAIKAKRLSDKFRAFQVVAPYVIKTAEKADAGELSNVELVFALKALAREMVPHTDESIESSGSSGVHQESDQISDSTRGA
jgi:hypothetical protein